MLPKLLPMLVLVTTTAVADDAVKKPETVMLAEAKGKITRNSEGSIIELKDGRLLIIYQEFTMGKGDSDFFPGRLVAQVSKDGGRTWGQYRVVAEPTKDDINVFSPSLIRLPNGDILFCFMRYHTFDKAANHYPPASAFAWVSKDDGESFKGLSTLWKEKPITLTSHTMHRLSTGRIVIPVNRDPSKKGEPDRWEANIYYSDDEGKTWNKGETWVTAPKRGAMEPHVAELSDKKLLMVMRTQLGSVYKSISADGGKTWSKSESLGVEAPESCPELARIPKSNDLVLIWNAAKYNPKHYSHFGKRTPLSAAISKDDGKTWSKPVHIETDPEWAFTNPGLTFTSKGTAVINYWACRYQSNGAMSNYPIQLKAAIVDVRWFYGGKE